MPFFRAMDINRCPGVRNLPVFHSGGRLCRLRDHLRSDVGGMPELINTGENGYIFPVGDDKRLAEYLIRLGSDAAAGRNFADALYEKASRDFSRDKDVRTPDGKLPPSAGTVPSSEKRA